MASARLSMAEILQRGNFDPGPGFRINTIVPRTETLLVLLLLSDSQRQVVMIEHSDVEWEVVSRVGLHWDPDGLRPDVTQPVGGIAQLGTTRYAPAQPGGGPPTSGWITVSGVAARDAEGVLAKTGSDV